MRFMRNRKQNTGLFLQTAILPLGPATEWKNPLCAMEGEYLLLCEGAPVYTQWKELWKRYNDIARQKITGANCHS